MVSPSTRHTAGREERKTPLGAHALHPISISAIFNQSIFYHQFFFRLLDFYSFVWRGEFQNWIILYEITQVYRIRVPYFLSHCHRSSQSYSSRLIVRNQLRFFVRRRLYVVATENALCVSSIKAVVSFVCAHPARNISCRMSILDHPSLRFAYTCLLLLSVRERRQCDLWQVFVWERKTTSNLAHTAKKKSLCASEYEITHTRIHAHSTSLLSFVCDNSTSSSDITTCMAFKFYQSHQIRSDRNNWTVLTAIQSKCSQAN